MEKETIKEQDNKKINSWRRYLGIVFPWSWAGYWRTLPYEERQRQFVKYAVTTIIIALMLITFLIILLFFR